MRSYSPLNFALASAESRSGLILVRCDVHIFPHIEKILSTGADEAVVFRIWIATICNAEGAWLFQYANGSTSTDILEARSICSSNSTSQVLPKETSSGASYPKSHSPASKQAFPSTFAGTSSLGICSISTRR